MGSGSATRPDLRRVGEVCRTFASRPISTTVLLYLTGGLINPFSLLLMAPVAIGATILSLASNIALSLLTIASIAVLGVFHQPLPWRGPPPELPEIYQAGVWAGLTLTTLLVTLYGWRLAEEARQMADALGAAQAALAREQRLSALGALAAAAAHELGTPLSTIAVVAKEMRKWVSRSLKTLPGMIRTLLAIARSTKADAVVPAGALGKM